MKREKVFIFIFLVALFRGDMYAGNACKKSIGKKGAGEKVFSKIDTSLKICLVDNISSFLKSQLNPFLKKRVSQYIGIYNLYLVFRETYVIKRNDKYKLDDWADLLKEKRRSQKIADHYRKKLESNYYVDQSVFSHFKDQQDAIINLLDYKFPADKRKSSKYASREKRKSTHERLFRFVLDDAEIPGLSKEEQKKREAEKNKMVKTFDSVLVAIQKKLETFDVLIFTKDSISSEVNKGLSKEYGPIFPAVIDLLIQKHNDSMTKLKMPGLLSNHSL